MKVLSIYFSATGGTETFQRVVQKVCRNYDIEFTELDITDNTIGISQKWLSQFDVFLIGSPIFFCSAPENVQHIIFEHFRNGLNKKVILYSTSASIEKSTIYGFANILKNRGYIVTGIVNVCSTNNFYYTDFFRPKQINSKQTVIQEYRLKARIIKKLLITSSNLYSIKNFRPISYLYFKIKFFILQRTFVPSFALRNFNYLQNQCIGCGICAKRCPNDNIEIHNNHPSFKNHCLACSRCIQCCPTNSITYRGKSIKQMEHLSIFDFENYTD